MKIVLASRNKNKIRELETLLKEESSEYGSVFGNDFRILSLDDIGFEGDIDENGDTFEQNALIKASVGAAAGYICIGDDSGLCVDALGGAPGIYSARYAENEPSHAKNRAKLLENLKGIKNRNAKFVSVIACKYPNGEEFTARGECAGEITEEEHGSGGFGYDSLFYIPEKKLTFAEMSEDEKNAISHRGRAIRAFAAEFAKRVKK